MDKGRAAARRGGTVGARLRLPARGFFQGRKYGAVAARSGRRQKISEGAAKQSGRDRIPNINNIINVNKMCETFKEYDLILVAYEEEKVNSLKQELKKLEKDKKIKIGIVIGPEGGIDKEEINKFKENNVKIITLGNRILRTETVALNMLSIIMYELDS